MLRLLQVLVLPLLLGNVLAEDFLRDKDEVESMLKGATLQGTYLRTGSSYTLEFRADGTLLNKSGASARWWVNEHGQYCREWLSGKLAGNQACMDLQRDGQQIRLYANGKQVAEGELHR
ncbi:MAG: hypothetical protein WCX90_03820 [Thiohalomonadaceae bacterium]